MGFYWGRGRAALRDAALWLALMAVIVAGYALRFELETVGRRMLAAVLPGYPAEFSDADGTAVAIEAGTGGHFAVKAMINGKAVVLIADTGASAVTLTPEDATTAGIDIGQLDYAVTVSTANGPARAAPYTLQEVAVGRIRRDHVDALIAEPGKLDASLLGMSFLRRLSSFEMRGDR
ncbi:MAG: TIGR02281 family clan AA aspartic protease, partial [Pseudomonadota bacterium]|nr:TIGR02281 family clan AA aspartic protease [Pseudomonadota bacterium]